MHTHETLARINNEWPSPLTNRERRAITQETAIRQLESRLGVGIDRTDPMLGAMAQMEMALMAMGRRQPWSLVTNNPWSIPNGQRYRQ
jgi:hypothetical protein